MAPFVYRHAQPFIVLWLTMPLAAAGTATGLALSGDPKAWVGLAIAMPAYALVLLLLGRFVIELGGSQLRWSLGFAGWPRWRLRIDEIERIERTRIATHGAMCLRHASQHRVYRASLGGPGLKLVLRDGRSITLGTPEPERLATFLEARLRR